jgi:hypothetical protein
MLARPVARVRPGRAIIVSRPSPRTRVSGDDGCSVGIPSTFRRTMNWSGEDQLPDPVPKRIGGVPKTEGLG